MGNTITFKRAIHTGTWATVARPQDRIWVALGIVAYLEEEAVISVEEHYLLRNKIERVEREFHEITRNMCKREDLAQECTCTLHPDVPARYVQLGQLLEELSELINGLLPEQVWFGIGPHGPTSIGLYNV